MVKAQSVLSAAVANLENKKEKLEAEFTTPVSYTHLDVYKRQGLQVAGWVFQKDDKVYLIVVEGFEKTITQFTPCLLYTSHQNQWHK